MVKQGSKHIDSSLQLCSHILQQLECAQFALLNIDTVHRYPDPLKPGHVLCVFTHCCWVPSSLNHTHQSSLSETTSLDLSFSHCQHFLCIDNSCQEHWRQASLPSLTGFQRLILFVIIIPVSTEHGHLHLLNVLTHSHKWQGRALKPDSIFHIPLMQSPGDSRMPLLVLFPQPSLFGCQENLLCSR